jgi:hypothetical protein
MLTTETEVLADKQLLYFSGDHHWSRDLAGLGCDAKALGKSKCLRNTASRTAEEVCVFGKQFPDSARGDC